MQQTHHRESGIQGVEFLPWGSHFCQFYNTRQDLIETLVPYFSAGLRNNESCLWITSEPLEAQEAKELMIRTVPDFASYMKRGQIEIRDLADWYTPGARFDADDVLEAWIEREQSAAKDGYSGLRLTGNTFWLERSGWDDFMEYEHQVNATFGRYRVLGLCTYCLEKCSAQDVIDVVRNHEFALTRREGRWEMIENAAIKAAKQELHKANLELERRVATRTAELRAALTTVETQKRALEGELADAQLLHEISAAFVEEPDIGVLYQKLLEAAALVMRSDFASMQRFDAEGGSGGKLELIACKGFSSEAAAFWKWVRPESASTCGAALRTLRRVIASDVEQCEFMAGSDDLAMCRGTGIRAVQTTPLLSRSGTLVGMISTHWKQPHEPAQRDLRLLDIIARQAADLVERKGAEEALREADRRKDEFLATLSHELRNPLAPIRSAVTLLQHSRDAAEVRHGALEILDRQVSHMVRLVDDLLDLARISRDTFELSLAPVELAAVLRSAVETAEPAIRAADHRLTVKLPQEPVILNVDAVRMAQVLANLLNNAARYTERGGEISVVAWREEGQVAIAVRDNGQGIAAEELPNIFDMFRSGHRGFSKGGLGIGLALGRRLAEMHGGTIEAASQGRGKGAQFVVRIPLPAGARLPALKVEERRRTYDGHRILVVDDNRDAAESMGMLLRMLGADVRLANDGPAALAAFEAWQPAAVLLDIGMPGMDGYEVARRLREKPAGRAVPLVAITGWGQEEDRKRTREAGFDRHLVKPADLPALESLLASLPADRARHTA